MLSFHTKCTLPYALSIREGEVHVWRALLNVGPDRLDSLRELLDEHECEQSRRMYYTRNRDSFIARRGILRSVLALYLRRDPSDIRFAYGQCGKPALAGENNEISFNLSHSSTYMLLAVGQGIEIGVDIERMNPMISPMEIADYFFTASEVLELRRKKEPERLRQFFRFWTRKEAFVKSTGLGLSYPIENVNVAFSGGESGRLVESEWMSGGFKRWVYDLNTGHGYMGALALGTPATILCRTLELARDAAVDMVFKTTEQTTT